MNRQSGVLHGFLQWSYQVQSLVILPDIDIVVGAMQVLTTQLAAKQNGYADVIYLDAKSDTYLEEVSSCNVFIVKGKQLKTPPLQVSQAPNAKHDSMGDDFHELSMRTRERYSVSESHTIAACITGPIDSADSQQQPRSMF